MSVSLIAFPDNYIKLFTSAHPVALLLNLLLDTPEVYYYFCLGIKIIRICACDIAYYRTIKINKIILFGISIIWRIYNINVSKFIYRWLWLDLE